MLYALALLADLQSILIASKESVVKTNQPIMDAMQWIDSKPLAMARGFVRIKKGRGFIKLLPHPICFAFQFVFKISKIKKHQITM